MSPDRASGYPYARTAATGGTSPALAPLAVVRRGGLVLSMAWACAGGGSAGHLTLAPEQPQVTSGFLARIAPFPVTDSTGRVLDLAFVGGLNVPRPQLLDADGDGDLDLFLQEYTDRLMYFERTGLAADGLPRFALRSTHYGGIDVGEWYRFVDLDGDGDQDLLAEWPFSYIRYWKNEGSTRAPRYVAAPDSLRDDQGRAIFADRQNILQTGDLHCDGLMDLLIGRITGTVVHYEQVPHGGTPTFRFDTDRYQNIEIVARFGGLHGANTMALADYDRDGDLDLFWGDFFEQGLLLIENVGTCRSPALTATPVRFPPGDPLLTSGYNAPAFGDLDGDGRMDLVVGVLGGAFNPNKTTIANLLYYRQDRDGQFRARTSQLLPMVDVGSESVPALADLDGDGDLDLWLGNKIDPSTPTSARLYRYDNIGTASRPALRLAGAEPIGGTYHYAPAFGDLDGDGDLDLILGSFQARLAYYRNDGGPGSPRLTLVDSALVTITRGSNTTPALGDLDGDGDLDLVVGSEADGLVLFRNQGSRAAPRFVRDLTFRLDVPAMAAPAFGDLDGDGDLDLMVGNSGGGVLYFERVGNPAVGRAVESRGAGAPARTGAAPRRRP